MKLFTIDFTKKPAERFFGLLRGVRGRAGCGRSANNVSQLAGFAKRDDLRYLLSEVCGMGYVHPPELAPTKEILDDYRKRGGDWKTYEGPVSRPYAPKADRGVARPGHCIARLSAL